MSDFKDLKVWQKAHCLAIAVNRAGNTRRAPSHSALRSQMIRAAMSIDANIAEGRGQRSDREQVRFLKIAVASCYELESHLIMARDLEFLPTATTATLLDQLIEVRKMLFGLMKHLSS